MGASRPTKLGVTVIAPAQAIDDRLAQQEKVGAIDELSVRECPRASGKTCLRAVSYSSWFSGVDFRSSLIPRHLSVVQASIGTGGGYPLPRAHPLHLHHQGSVGGHQAGVAAPCVQSVRHTAWD